MHRSNEPLFSDGDLRLIEALDYRPELEPSFDEIKACLIWEDERPVGLTPMGYERLSDLWIIRSYIHRGISRTEWGIDPSTGYFQELWDRVQASRISWPGFRRLKLSEKERAYLENCLRDLSRE